MSDQDKPTEVEQWFCNKCGYVGDTQHHHGCNYNAALMRTSGEWTAQDVYRIIRDAGDGANHALAKAINAALAAERDERYRAILKRGNVIRHLREQLAAANRQCKTISALMQDANKELAAEREKAGLEWHKGWAAAVEAGEGNKARLIAETRQPLVDALFQGSDILRMQDNAGKGQSHAETTRRVAQALSIIDAALAKVVGK